MLTLDGSQGEGGGQILRTALTLSMVTGRPFAISKIRANRTKPGLMRQHLACVLAAAEICGATFTGADLRSQALTFTPGPVRAGTYRFAIGSAGSTTLVLQTVLLPLALAGADSQVTIEGGTHNPMAPPFEFLAQAFLPQIRKLGFNADVVLTRAGFYPAGGGGIVASIAPAGPQAALDFCTRGALLTRHALAAVANLPFEIAQREAKALQAELGLDDAEVAARSIKADGPGNVVSLALAFAAGTAIFTGFGEQGVSAEQVAGKIAREAEKYLKSDAAVDSHLADQLLLPMALSGGGSFTTTRLTPHTLTNIEVIRMFLPIDVTVYDETALRRRVELRHRSAVAGQTPLHA